VKNRFKTQRLIVFLVAVATVFSVVKVRAASSNFPEIISGSTKVTTSSGEITYGGLGGNHAVLNNNTNGDLGFNKTEAALGQIGCIWQLFTTGMAACFSLGTGNEGQNYYGGSGRLMTSQTLVDGNVVYEIPALIFLGLNVDGDVYSGEAGSTLEYLAKFWNPANLFEGAGAADGAGWAPGSSYVFNPAAQVKYGSNQYKQYIAQLKTLAGSGQPIAANDFLFTSNFSLQADTPINFFKNNSKGDLAKFPDGKVWVVNGNLTINNSANFNGIGTIVVNGGNLTINQNKNILPNSTSGDKLGIIVLKKADGTGGNCNFGGNNKINVMMYCESNFEVTGNGEFTGSFVASDFSINQNQSVLFSYDPAFDNSQPPGFRNLAMPRSEEVGNKN